MYHVQAIPPLLCVAYQYTTPCDLHLFYDKASGGKQKLFVTPDTILPAIYPLFSIDEFDLKR